MQPSLPAHKLNILVVEDNADLRHLLCELLQNFGHVPISADSAEKAMIQLEAGCAVDVLLTDVSLPGKSGIVLAREVVATQPHIHVVFASGYSNALTVNLDFPAHSVTKPYDIDRLNALLVSLATSRDPVDIAACIP